MDPRIIEKAIIDMAQDSSSNNPEDAWSFDDLIELPEVQRRLVHEKYEKAQWTRVFSLQQPYFDPEFTVLLASRPLMAWLARLTTAPSICSPWNAERSTYNAEATARSTTFCSRYWLKNTMP